MKNLKNKMLDLGLSPKREFIIILSVNFGFVIAGIICFILFKNLLFTVICLGFAIVFSLFYIKRYDSILQKINNENIEDFSNLFSYFRIYIHNGFSVYSALKEIVLFANPNLKKLLKELIEEIDADKTVQPFVNFSKHFNEIIIEEMMISIYQMIDDGEQSNYLKQFELIFDKFSDLLYQKKIKKKDSKLGTLTSSALIGSAFLIIALTVGVISIIGDLVNGL